MRDGQLRPKILVGTLSCSEAEVALCCEQIANQSGVDIHHVLFENLTELEAHRKIFGLWNEKRSNYDLFVKIDADTVLNSKDALINAWSFFENDTDVTAIQVGLYDFFTKKMIAGLNMFRPNVYFDLPEDKLFCDRVKENGHRKVLTIEDTKSLYPIGDHCRFPSDKQAFHFGYRRWAKGQVEIIRDLLNSWLIEPEIGRLWALSGVYVAFIEGIVEDCSYENIGFLQQFQKTEMLMSTAKGKEKIVRGVTSILKESYLIRGRRVLNQGYKCFKGVKWV